MKIHIIAALLLTVLYGSVTAQEGIQNIALKNAEDSVSYSFGLLIGNNLKVQNIEKINFDLLMQGLKNGYAENQDVIRFEDANFIIQDYFTKKTSDESDMNLKESISFLEENKTMEGVITLPSGLQYKELAAGNGESPQATDKVKVHYHGTFIDGEVFDSSKDRGEPIVFGVTQVIPGWTEALQLMKPGSRWMLYIPPGLAYGEQGAGGVIGPNQALVFEVELIEIIPQ
ncbi:MAG: FKBP-type peptidyl-prolyl cis-trans isomerase [Bacteroidales bacterium]|nr:FKBP-type peptidyl-prolyl cis-trans isomerase [Bacteroidales bacterium]